MPKGDEESRPPSSVDWPRWMRGLGRHKRRVREFLGLSQEQLARLAGVSQGAISRLEAGRGLATPLLVVMKLNVALKRAFDQIDPALLSEEARRLREIDERTAPESAGSGFEPVPILRDPGLEELVRLYNELPDRQRQKLLTVIRATTDALREG
jgi:transcriptional regulator with XRE-family HTH domain